MGIRLLTEAVFVRKLPMYEMVILVIKPRRCTRAPLLLTELVGTRKPPKHKKMDLVLAARISATELPNYETVP